MTPLFPARASKPGLFYWVLRLFSLAAASVVLVALATGCGSPAYYSQAARGHLQVMAGRTPCQQLMEDPGVSAELKTRLVMARQMCEFAERELALEVNGHYQAYADLGRPFVVWNVYAARELSLTPKTWWYPFVGRLDYRGYFKESAARHLADKLERQGWETYVEGAIAYSTLGWFHDPLLNTFLWSDEGALAETLFHELAHQRVFAPGDTDFNEAFATVVGREGARRWLQSRREAEALRAWTDSLKLEQSYVKKVLAARDALQEIYSQYNGEEPPPDVAESVRRQKDTILTRLTGELASLSGQEPASGHDWNHARLNSLATYYGLVPSFEALLAAHRGDLRSFHETVERLAGLPVSERVPALLAHSE